MPFLDSPFLGFGLGLRPIYYDHFLEQKPDGVSWVEAVTENYISWKNHHPIKSTALLEKVRSHLPVVLHGVSLSIGSVDPLDREYLKRLKELAHRIEPAWISDHLCWTGVHGENNHDLLPLPYTDEAIRVVVTKVQQVQEALGRRLLLENVSSYLEFAHSELTEWEFLTEVSKRADCGILLDINNIYVSSINHRFAPLDYLNAIPTQRVGQIHLAGHTTDPQGYCIDTHDHPIIDPVWDLYRHAARRFGRVSTMIERDDKFPPWETLMAELGEVKRIWEEENERSYSVRDSITVPAFA